MGHCSCQSRKRAWQKDLQAARLTRCKTVVAVDSSNSRHGKDGHVQPCLKYGDYSMYLCLLLITVTSAGTIKSKQRRTNQLFWGSNPLSEIWTSADINIFRYEIILRECYCDYSHYCCCYCITFNFAVVNHISLLNKRVTDKLNESSLNVFQNNKKKTF